MLLALTCFSSRRSVDRAPPAGEGRPGADGAAAEEPRVEEGAGGGWHQGVGPGQSRRRQARPRRPQGAVILWLFFLEVCVRVCACVCVRACVCMCWLFP